MQDKAAEQSAQLTADLTYRVRDIAMDVGLLMVTAIFTLLGGTGLLGHIIGVAYPLSGLMVPDAALAGFLAGIGLFGWLFHRQWLCYLAAAPLALITLYTLAHNVLAGGPWNGTSWVSDGPRILSAAAFLLFMVAVCVFIGTRQRWCRCVWAISGLLGLGAGSFSLLMMLLPANRLEWAEGFVSAPILATLYALLGGTAFIGAAWRGSRRLIPLGRLTQLAAIGGVIVSCLAWYILSWSAQSDLQRRAATLMDNAALDAQHTMQAQRELIQRLAWRQAMINTLPTQGRWQQQTQPYFQHAPYIKALALLGPTGEVKEMSFSSQQTPSQLAQAISNSSLSEWLSTDWQDPWSLAVPGKPNTMLMVASLGDFADGLVVAELDVADLLEQALSVQLDHFRLTAGGDTPYLTMSQSARDNQGYPKRPLPHLETRHVGLPGGGLLTLDVHMDSVSGMLRAGMMPAGFAIAGLLLSYLLALSLGLFRMVLFRSRDLAAAQLRLAAQYDLEQRYRSLYLYHPDGVFSVDLEGRIVTANEACSKITGRSNDDVIGHHFSTLLRPQDTERLKSLFAITLNGQPTQVALEIIHRDGSLRSLDLTTMPIIVEGTTQGVFGIAKDVTQQHEQEAQLAYQATHDLLTGLPNRTSLDESLEEAYEQALQDNSLIVAMHLDLDGFKAVNDGLGYHIGNLLLAEVADRLRRVIGPYDTLARLTGDEFALLTNCLIGCAAAKTMANRMLDTLSAPFHIEGKAIHISASIGIACNCESVEHAYELMQRADLAMADAKQKGRNTWQWYQGDELRITEDAVMLRHDLHEALQKEQLELYYQPIVEAISGRIRGFEALIRWHHPDRGMISPGVFIPLAEQTGQIISLGRWIMRRVCQDTVTMQARNAPVVPVALNISSLQFRREGFLQDIQQALTTSGLPPEWLELEVTESVLLDGPEQAIELINTLKAMGIKVALDDFGTGFSSLSYLRDLPIHKVKLDRAFIQDITKDSRNAAIVQGIITMAHHMDLVVVAEGIEERDQQEDLIRRKCDLLQGFLFAKPMPLADAMELPEVLPSTRQD